MKNRIVFISLLILLYGVSAYKPANSSFVFAKRKTQIHFTSKIIVARINESKAVFKTYKKPEIIWKDSSSFGTYKVEIYTLKNTTTNKFNTEQQEAIIILYNKSKENWIQKQSLKINSDCHFPFNPKIADFNNDGFNDLTLETADAARAANERRSLLIFDNNNQCFIPIKNSNKHPNLQYNKKLNCIDSWAFHAGVTTTFLSLINDSLVAFSKVDYTDGICKAYKINQTGNSTLIYSDTSQTNHGFPRFTNFDPVEID